MIKMYLFLKRNRFRKKWKLWKRFISITFDFTTLLYMLAFLAYVFVAIYKEGSIAFNLDQKIMQLELVAIDSYWYILTIIPLVRLSQAFQSPGIMFTSAEYHLTILPYSRTKLWFLLAIERWLKAAMMYIILGTIISLLTPISLSVILTYVGLLLLLNILMTTVEWKFFQQKILVKIGLVIFMMIVNGISFISGTSIIAIGFMILLISVNGYLVRTLFDQVDWQNVTAANDFKLWNMKAISYATNIKYKKDRKYSMWQRMNFWKKPFPYIKSTMYHRLWHLYLEKNIGLIFQLIGALLFMLVVLSFLPDWLFLLAIIITISIYTTFAVSLFKDRLASDIVQVLPWDMEALKMTFVQWMLVSGLIFFIPLIIKALFDFSLWTVAQWIVMMFAFYLLLHLKLDRAIREVDHEYPFQEWLYLLSFGLMLIILFSSKYPLLLLIGCLIVGFAPFYLGVKKTAH